jgi:hypothetical protein
MRIIITERQFKVLISEETTGVDSFFDLIEKKYFAGKFTRNDISQELYLEILRHQKENEDDDIPEELVKKLNSEKEFFNIFPEELKAEIQRVFNETNTKNIKFDTFNIAALGLSTPDGVILNSNILRRGFYEVLFILFHELAHQYQYKKYGDKAMLDIYFDEMSLEDAAKFMLDVEHVADEYGARKLKQIIRRGLIPNRFGDINDNTIKRYKGYTNINERSLMGMISHTKDLMRKNNITNHEQVSEFMYNLIKGQI